MDISIICTHDSHLEDLADDYLLLNVELMSIPWVQMPRGARKTIIAKWKDGCFIWTPSSFHVFFGEKYFQSPFGSPP